MAQHCPQDGDGPVKVICSADIQFSQLQGNEGSEWNLYGISWCNAFVHRFFQTFTVLSFNFHFMK